MGTYDHGGKFGVKIKSNGPLLPHEAEHRNIMLNDKGNTIGTSQNYIHDDLVGQQSAFVTRKSASLRWM